MDEKVLSKNEFGELKIEKILSCSIIKSSKKAKEFERKVYMYGQKSFNPLREKLICKYLGRKK